MNINGANNFGTYGVSYGFNAQPTMPTLIAKPMPRPMPAPKAEIFCQPIQNFRIDGGSVNLQSRKVSIDWPEFRPQSAIFAGPRVKQDTTNLYTTPMPNYNFDDCGFTSDAYYTTQDLLPGFQTASTMEMPGYTYDQGLGYDFGNTGYDLNYSYGAK